MNRNLTILQLLVMH